MKKILAFGASNSRNSINKLFANYAASQIENSIADLLDLNDFEMPIYSIDIERESGIPEAAYKFRKLIHGSDGIIISFAEHNGHYTVAFKNIFDWLSRIDRNIWMNKPMFLLATAPGPRGAKKVLEHAELDMGRKGGNIVSVFSMPSIWENFNLETGINNSILKAEYDKQLMAFEKALMNDISTIPSQ